jgi:hypothetical protein
MIFGVKRIYWSLCDGALLNINQLVLANWLFYNVGAVTYMDARTNLIIANGKTITPNVSECVYMDTILWGERHSCSIFEKVNFF